MWAPPWHSHVASGWRAHADLPGAIPFVNADWAWCDEKYELGKADAAAHHEELAAFFANDQSS